MNNTAKPLKWHHFLQYVGLPLIILGNFVSLLNIILDLFGRTNISVVTYIRMYSPALFGSFGNEATVLITMIILYAIMMLALSIFIWIGFFNWMNSARITWLIYLGIRVVISVILTSFFGMVIQEVYPPFSFSYYVSVYLSSIFIALVLATILLGLIWILNIVYYHRRKEMFAFNYAHHDIPEHANAEPVQENTKPIETPVTEDKTEETQSQEAPQEPEKKKFCPHCGAELGEGDVHFCTHCGYKLDD